jgi:hypothetical protein
MSEPRTLHDFIGLSSADIEKAMAEQARDGGAAQEAVTQLGGFAARVGADEINKALDLDMYDLLAHGWAKVQAVRDAAAKSRATPGQTTMVTLGQHELTHSCHPVLAFYVGDAPLPELKLTLELVARFKSVALSIADSTLHGLAPGDASAVVRLKYKTVKIKEQATPDWKFPGMIRLGSGVRID